MEEAIEEGYRVCVWQGVDEKDINDMVLAGRTPEQVRALIDSNAVSGIEARLKWSQWKRV